MENSNKVPLDGGTVTVTKKGKRYRSSFSILPGKSFGPWDLPEMIRDLAISALLSPREARDLVFDAAANGSATRDTNLYA